MKTNLISKKVNIILFFIFTVFFGQLVFSQTDYTEIPLDGTPIDVAQRTTDSNQDNFLLQPSFEQSSDFAISNSVIGESGISETSGVLATSPTGASTYTVPIKLPPGINGIQPQIAISYNSQAGNGTAGYGWNISGISSISRIPSTKYHDGIIDPVDFDGYDRFSLDGQHLLLKSGTYGTSGAEYQTEIYSNLKIVSHGSQTISGVQGPQYFSINYPDGSIAYYGLNTNSRSHMEYAITYWQNPQGIRIDYTYTSSGNGISIASIKYGHRSGSTAPNTIQFQYVDRKRPEQAYINGIDFQKKNILKQINVTSGGIGYRNYLLSHTENGSLGYQSVSSITEKSGDNSKSHSPIYFSYNRTNASIGVSQIQSTLSVSNIEERNANVVPLDFTGNGKMDFIVYPKNRNDRTKYWIFKDLQSSSATNIGAQVNSTPFESMFPVTYLNSADKLDVAQGYAVIQHSGTSTVEFKVNGQSIYGPAAQYYKKTWNAPYYKTTSYCGGTTYNYRVPMEYLSGDFDGDGLSDAIAISRPYSYFTCVNSRDCDGGGGGGPQPIMMTQSVMDSLDLARQLPQENGNGNGNGGGNGNGNGNNGGNGNGNGNGNGGGNVNSENPEEINDESYILRAAGTDTCCVCNSVSVSNSQAYYIDLDRRVSTNFTKSIGSLTSALSYTDELYTADADGDGKTDIIQVKKGKVYVYGFTGSYLRLLWTVTDSRIRKDNFPIYLGDYNGDGKIDFMAPTTANSNSFTLFRSTGTTFIATTGTQPFYFRLSNTTYSPVTTYNLVPSDINGDGRTDMLEYKTVTNNNGTGGEQQLTMYTNSFSTSLSVTPRFVQDYVKKYTSNLNHFPIPVFLSTADGSNSNLDFATISNNRVFRFSFAKDHQEEMLLRSVRKNGIYQYIDYGALDPEARHEGHQYYHYTYGENLYPYIDLKTSRSTKVVTKFRRYGGYPISDLIKRFAYKDPIAHADGIGFMGFSAIASTEWHTDSSDRIWNISKSNIIDYRGAPVETYRIPYTLNFNTVPSDYIIRTNFSYDVSLAANKVFKLSNSSHTRQNRLEGTATSTHYLHDEYNNPTRITTDYSGQASSVVNMQYYNSTGTTYYIGRPKLQSSTSVIDGNSFSTEEKYTYSGSLLTVKEYKGNNTAYNKITYSYDTFGNVINTSNIPNGETPRSSSFKFDTSGRFITESRGADGLKTLYSYNINKGTLKSETDPIGRKTEYFYDTFDRLNYMVDYLGKTMVVQLVEDSSNNYSVRNIGDDSSYQISYFDKLKRNTKATEKNALNEWVSVSVEYDKFDRPYKQSEPYIGSSPTQWNKTEYDFYGRPKSVMEYTGRSTTYTYSGLNVTVSDGTKSTTTTVDAMGNVKRVTDEGGSIDYTYYGNGSLRTVKYGGLTITMEQDGWGRKTKLTDPSAGSYTYAYNGFGEIERETTPKGETIYEYDPSGYLLKKMVTGDAGTDMEMIYAYNANKLPTSISLNNADGNNGTTTFSYDNYGRLNTSTESNSFATFITRLVYDSYGRVDTEENEARLSSPSRSSKVKFKNVYAYGGLKQLMDANTSEIIYNITATNGRGQVTTSTYGNGQRLTNTYDTFGYLKEQLYEKGVTASAATVAKLTYNFDEKRGTLKNRGSSLFVWNETFAYDNQDRLTNFNDNNGSNSQNYDPKGRINTISALGTFVYANQDYQQIGLEMNAAGKNYFGTMGEQKVTHNAFKAPVEIIETGQDRISFQYNATLGRAHMFYGGTETDKSQRRFRRHYSQDGTMEITHDAQTGKTSFVTYAGGDAYSAPAIYRSEQGGSTINQYLYLQRDYLGSILGIADKNGTLKEKRHFDAWGNIVRWTNGSGQALADGQRLLDRGYTGHEHLHGSHLIHMNGRIYDPKLHRFLMPDNFVQDPYNTQNFNRYSYVLNNPLMYVDPSGEMTESGMNEGWLSKILSSPFVSYGSGVIGLYESFFGPINWDNVGDGIARPFREAGRWYEKNIGKPINKWFNKHIWNPIFGDGKAERNDFSIHNVSIATNVSTGMNNFNEFKAGGGNGGSNGLGITTGDVLRTGADFVPFVGSGLDIYEGIRDGDGWQVAMGVGFVVLDVFTLGSASLIKGAVKTGVKVGARKLVGKAGKHALNKAMKTAQMTTREAAAVARNSKLAPLMRGKAIDRAFRQTADKNLILRGAQKVGIIKINPTNRGADMIGTKLLNGTWWDVTTPGAWQRHVDNYGPGGLKDLIYR